MASRARCSSDARLAGYGLVVECSRMSNGKPSSHGPAWDSAVEFGIDVSLIESNARLTPAQRIRELVAMNRLHEQIQARTLTPEERDALYARELREELERFGPELEAPSDTR